MSEKDGGSAFPQIESERENGTLVKSEVDIAHVYSFGGMSLRDYFAAKALPMVIAKYEHLTAVDPDPVPAIPQAAADLAYEYADAMLRAREAK
jgi:hypothetical protein